MMGPLPLRCKEGWKEKTYIDQFSDHGNESGPCGCVGGLEFRNIVMSNSILYMKDLIINIIIFLIPTYIAGKAFYKYPEDSNLLALSGLTVIFGLWFVTARYLHVSMRLWPSANGLPWEKCTPYLWFSIVCAFGAIYFYIKRVIRIHHEKKERQKGSGFKY